MQEDKTFIVTVAAAVYHVKDFRVKAADLVDAKRRALNVAVGEYPDKWTATTSYDSMNVVKVEDE